MICGIAAEYDPFHNGHLYLLEEARRLSGADTVICVVSMAFTQRGDAAFFDAYDRAEMAIRAGADLVIGLPFSYSVCAADRFALGCVFLLKQLGAQAIAFGVEDNAKPYFHSAVHALEEESAIFRDILRALMQKGCSYPRAKNHALAAVLDIDESVLSQPNFTLALAYALADIQTGKSLAWFPVSRKGALHGTDSLSNDRYASASAIRRLLSAGEANRVFPYVPETSFTVIQRAVAGHRVHPKHALDPILRWTIRESGALPPLYDASEGLADRFPRALNCLDRDEAVHALKSKRYSYTKVNRLLTQAMVGADSSQYSSVPDHAYLLGFRTTSSFLVKRTVRGGFPLLNRIPPRTSDLHLQTDAKAYDLWCLGAGIPFGQLYRAVPFRLGD